MNPSDSELERRFHTALQNCYELADVTQAPYRCLAALKAVIPGDVHGWDQFSISTGAHDTFADYHPHQLPILASAVDGIRHCIMDHPVATLMRNTPQTVPRVSQMTSFLSRRQIRDTGIYQEGYRLLRVADNLVLHFRDGDTDVGVSAHHNHGARYSPEQERRAALLAPHFLQALRNARIYTATLHGRDGYTLLLDTGGKIPDWPAPLRETLARSGMVNHSPGLDKWLKDQITNLKQPGYSEIIPRPFIHRSPGLAVEFHFLPPKYGFGLYCRLDKKEKLSEDKLRLLTKRELEVLSWIAAGKRDSEIAQILGISRRTAEQHAANILRKLDVETRTTAAQAYLAREAP